MSDTPETDAKVSEHIGFYSCATVPAELCRRMERERDEARKQRNCLHELHNKNAIRSKELLELCGTLRKELDEARKELEEYRSIAENIDAEKAVSEKEKAITTAIQDLASSINN